MAEPHFQQRRLPSRGRLMQSICSTATIEVVVFAIARNFTWIHPHLITQIFVVVINARIDDTNHNLRGIASESAPSLRGLDCW